MHARRKGFVLIGALWLMAAISLATLELAVQGTARRAMALNRVEDLRARAAAQSAVDHAILLLKRELERQDSGADAWRRFHGWAEAPVPMQDAIYTFTLRDPHTAVNLNLAERDQLVRLLAALGEPPGSAKAAADAVVAGRPHANTGDITAAAQIDESLYQRLEPYLTTAGSGRINIALAPRPVLLSLPGFSEEAARAVERRRADNQPLVTVFEIAAELSPAARRQMESEFSRLALVATLGTTAIEIRTAGSGADGRVARHAAALVVRSGQHVGVAWRTQ